MEKNTLKAIAVIAMIIGAFGLTFGIFAMSQPGSINPILLLSQIPGTEGDAAPEPQGGVLNTWYTCHDGTFTTGSAALVNITDVTTSITISGTDDVSLYISFVTQAIGVGGDRTTWVGFALDNITIDPPIGEFGMTSASDRNVAITLQHVIHNVSPGIHTVQVQCNASAASVQLGPAITLLIQSLSQ